VLEKKKNSFHLLEKTFPEAHSIKCGILPEQGWRFFFFSFLSFFPNFVPQTRFMFYIVAQTPAKKKKKKKKGKRKKKKEEKKKLFVKTRAFFQSTRGRKSNRSGPKGQQR